ncbi:hypothetical protein ACMFMG_011998 [Clarireedia jacksonii]
MAPDLPEPLFVADLKFNDVGTFTFGKIPYEGQDIRFWNCNIEEKDFWRIPITAYAIGELEGEEPPTEAAVKKIHTKPMLDTGCSSLRLPSCIIQDYYAKTPAYRQEQGHQIFPSDKKNPDLILYIGEDRYMVRIPGKFIWPQGTFHGEPFVAGALEEQTDGFGPILGQPFFYTYNVIFKGIDALSVGLVKKE